jgi:glycerophosphodiester phosphodiesterase
LQYLVLTLSLSLTKKDINERNVLHRICLKKNASPHVISALLKLDPSIATQTDFLGRRPLHYAAESNQPNIAKCLLQHGIQNSYYQTGAGFADPVWQDHEGFTPLFFGIIHGSTNAVKEIIETGEIDDIDILLSSSPRSPSLSSIDTTSSQEILPDYARSLHHPSSIALACKLSNIDLLKLLIMKGASVNLSDQDGDTPLLFAIRSRFIEGIKVLIFDGQVDINLPERINGWTPLMIAAIEGFSDVIQILLDAGASKDTVDYNMWTASEHATFRGYLEIGRTTLPTDPKQHLHGTPVSNGDESKSVKSSGKKTLSRASRLYGHTYLTEQTMILITLGSNDVRNMLCHHFIQLSKEFQPEDGRLSLSVTATNASGKFPIIDLPADLEESFHPDPIVIFTQNPDEVVLRFDIIETFGSSRSSQVLARGTSLLTGDSIFSKPKGFKACTDKISLRGQYIVPLVQVDTLECAGTLGFEFFVITPFKHDKMRIGDRYTYYKSVDTQVIGHRGSGMNRRGSKLQVGENTVLSFITAASLGAEYIEFGKCSLKKRKETLCLYNRK